MSVIKYSVILAGKDTSSNRMNCMLLARLGAWDFFFVIQVDILNEVLYISNIVPAYACCNEM